MALRPTGGGIERPGSGPVARPARGRAVARAPQRQPDSAPTPGFRLRTATTEADIDRQIVRLMGLIANDNIDRNAPPGSYFNVLV